MENKTLQNKVFEALGEVSMCWSETPKGVFESSRAEEIGNRLMHDIKMQKPVIDEDNMQEYIKQINDLGVEVVKIEPSVKEAVEVLCNALREDEYLYNNFVVYLNVTIAEGLNIDQGKSFNISKKFVEHFINDYPKWLRNYLDNKELFKPFN